MGAQRLHDRNRAIGIAGTLVFAENEDSKTIDVAKVVSQDLLPGAAG